jgi:hypothetical protein
MTVPRRKVHKVNKLQEVEITQRVKTSRARSNLPYKKSQAVALIISTP